MDSSAKHWSVGFLTNKLIWKKGIFLFYHYENVHQFANIHNPYNKETGSVSVYVYKDLANCLTDMFLLYNVVQREGGILCCCNKNAVLTMWYICRNECTPILKCIPM